MHCAEQILRAELAEKRQLLKNIRKELEETRASWNIVKQKNAESEIQWLKLKADCEERRRILMSSSESGFSELGMTDKTDGSDVEFWSPRVTLFWSLSSRSERRPNPQS